MYIGPYTSETLTGMKRKALSHQGDTELPDARPLQRRSQRPHTFWTFLHQEYQRWLLLSELKEQGGAIMVIKNRNDMQRIPVTTESWCESVDSIHAKSYIIISMYNMWFAWGWPHVKSFVSNMGDTYIYLSSLADRQVISTLFLQ